MKFIPKNESGMPDLAAENWRLIKTLTVGFTYYFYHDTTRPQLMVAAMKVAGELPCGGELTRLSWQVGDNIRTVRLELDEMVQENPIAVIDGKRYELDGIMEKLSAKTEPKM
ncbi:hypothetical protein A3G55_00245 [Candidatus Giovannonibacteria bacterium RIFCSPLOWO2_12_FULL_44_25]|uniref:Uncharacterized protein n=2 Tax=Candidatus Giovannoniibacteriota TaxID=1752738 RepID=A0A1F5W820_9BACT|nr:MAG: hypothetical protein UW15_C0021G0005 [Parcubacteria group bacterium GW2011_GWC1_44_10]KKT59295.1 MAG: hypothetical protein UW53_C0016G0005 [Candidatus Giovannonibacteria bacterium GW2011_GWA1_44_25]KKU29051.1 MAG: hypothetical protein UX43_C0016G0006 [Candidatus Giovannonibacteria bacterium GW2011_GWB1_46_20]OGF49265.1 MAG: hypothetical protein A2120_03030 [Candidatus Giovannonibacteria bacterium GWA2_45_15]OGF60163.1 MAG: hypothetical protein A2656_04300 [Candidatus Giovannonibacteria 